MFARWVRLRWIARQTMRRMAVIRWNNQENIPPRWVETVRAFT
jgi:hypothetical protein